ncbi:hypothetical protein DAI22_06g157303 [Oryza sativa Japonica Group]|nr:hypothetical protein DAI22_06g157303 [Oryza sativa Japonica Group]
MESSTATAAGRSPPLALRTCHAGRLPCHCHRHRSLTDTNRRRSPRVSSSLPPRSYPLPASCFSSSHLSGSRRRDVAGSPAESIPR